MKRAFLIVIDSLGIGEMPDAYKWGDAGSNTLASIRRSDEYHCPHLERLGLLHIDGIREGRGVPMASFARMEEASRGKDTTVGHWEIAGLLSENPLPTYPDGFPDEIIEEFSRRTGRAVLCNKPYSGTDVIRDFGEEHLSSGALIVYTSADSVFQIAAHVDKVPLEQLYEYCRTAREILVGKHGVGRVIARPFGGEHPFVRTSGRHDFSLEPPSTTLPELVKAAGLDSISVGKIYDIFAGRGFTESHPTVSNSDGMDKLDAIMQRDFSGLCFVNLVDFDSSYGHRNDVDGYARALSEFDVRLGKVLEKMREEDLLIITADHGCDPATPSTDHSREYTPMLAYGASVASGVDLGTRRGFFDIGAVICDYLGIEKTENGKSFLQQILRK